jgi:hypothetical protein
MEFLNCKFGFKDVVIKEWKFGTGQRLQDLLIINVV